MLDAFPGPVHELWAINKAVNPNDPLNIDCTYTPEFLHSLTPSGFPPALLKLKIRAAVIMFCSLQLKHGIGNSSWGIVMRLTCHVLKVHLLSRNHVLLPWIKLIYNDPDMPYYLYHLQFPVNLAFAMMINKSQGQSFYTVGVNLCHLCFTHSQLYVTVSCMISLFYQVSHWQRKQSSADEQHHIQRGHTLGWH